jgi:hypothetical protein
MLVLFNGLAGVMGLRSQSTVNGTSFTADFKQWRFGSFTDDTYLDHPRQAVWTLPPEIMRRCADSVVMAMPENPVGQHGTDEFFFTDERLTHFLNNADHIYVICMTCKRLFPSELTEKVSIISGRLSDECLAKYAGTKELTGHLYKVTLAHRIAITHAKANDFKMPLVLEEDVVFKEDVNQFDFNPIVKLVHNASKEWELLRLAWHDYVDLISNGCAVANVRSCNQWVEQNMCTIPSRGFISSAAYIIPARSFDRFLSEGQGKIDGGVLNQFKQTVLTPTLCNQEAHMTDELITEDTFIQKCKAA